ncbi:MAG: MaoC family dehydratase [SAR324 cluster bacterium]|nr:MaoC family dehydratase [SAR324 cluster bacterium]
MTRPIELKPREDEVRGTPPEAYQVGVELPEMRFTITPDIVEEYITAVEGDPALYEVDGRRCAPPNVLAVYLLAVVYRKYPPIQGIILTDVSWRFHHPIWAGEDTAISCTGKVVEKFAKQGKHFVRWRARFHRADGILLASAQNTMYIPAQRYEKR